MAPDPRAQTEVTRAPDSVASREVPKILALRDGAPERGFALTRAFATVGRHPTSDFVIDDPRVSGTHLELTVLGDRVRVRDAGSTNGTWMGLHRVVELEVTRGAEIQIGDTRLVFGVESDAAAARLGGTTELHGLVGHSRAMRELFATLERVAPKDLSVLVQGDTGTGKEHVARAIHAASPRARHPFVVVDVPSLPDALAEQLLFGHAREAGGHTPGLFELARGGTLFIDEVGELPLPLQAKILGAIERRAVTPIGTNEPLAVDARIVASTQRDLRNELEAGRFREDLYFRLAQVRTFIPPLRARAEDVPLLVDAILKRGGTDVAVEPAALEYLAGCSWPGNVRELSNVVLRAAALSAEGVIRRSDVAGEGAGFRGTSEERTPLDLSGTFSDAKERAIERFERAYLTLLMKRSGGNLSAASRDAAVARHHLRDLLKKRGLYGASFGDE